MMDGTIIAVGVLMIVATLVFIVSRRRNQEQWGEYCVRFIEPAVKRAYEKGIPAATLDQMWAQAVRESDPTTVGRAPVSILRDLIDEWEPEEE